MLHRFALVPGKATASFCGNRPDVALIVDRPKTGGAPGYPGHAEIVGGQSSRLPNVRLPGRTGRGKDEVELLPMTQKRHSGFGLPRAGYRERRTPLIAAAFGIEPQRRKITHPIRLDSLRRISKPTIVCS